MNKEMIERLKQNRVDWRLLTQEEKECFDSVGAKNNCQWFDGKDWVECYCREFNCSSIVYRIKSGYQPPKPEPKIVKYEIYIGDGNWLSIKTHWIQTDIRGVVAMPNFSHFEKANGNRIGIENIATEIRNGGKVYACFEEQGE